MLKSFILTVIIGLICATTVFSANAVIVCERVQEGGNRHWSDQALTLCWWPGTTCIITRYPDVNENSISIEQLEYGYLLNGSFNSIQVESYGLTPQLNSNTNMNGFTFMEGECTLRIVSCGEFPCLDNVTVYMDDVTLSSGGCFQLLIPPME
jgi:hypothetical protein